MLEIIKWLWLTTKPGMNPHKIQNLLDRYGSIHNIYKQKSYELPKIRSHDIELLLDKSLDKAEDTYKRVKECGASIMTCDNKHYPEMLKNIRPMPHVLYLKGAPMDFDNILGIGIVGTRLNTDYGGRCAYRISYDIAKRGAVVVSGLAKGIDKIAMMAAIKAGARTIGVMGCGIDMVYPPSHRALYDEVQKNGLIISEYPPGTIPFRGNFPQRNRIIAGLSKGVLVVEGSKNSGSLITARFALEYDRDVFAVPHNIDETEVYGTNYLIQDGAKLVMCADDILSEYEFVMPYLDMRVNPIPSDIEIDYKKSVRVNAPPGTGDRQKPQVIDISAFIEKAESELEKSIIKLLEGNELYMDEIARGLDKNIYEISPVLMMMETTKILIKLPGDRYRLNT